MARGGRFSAGGSAAAPNFIQGQRILHRTFGEGVVSKSIVTRAGEELVVQFDDFGVKIISADVAPIVAI